MNPIWVDVFAICALVLFVSGGERLGLLAACLAWGGLFLGVIAGGALVGALFNKPSNGNPSEGFIFALMIVITLAFVGQSLGVLGGNAIKGRFSNDKFKLADKIAGAIAGFLVWATLFWVLFPAVADHPGASAQAVRGSKVAQILDSELPTPPNILGSLESFFGTGAFPQVFDALRPAPDVPNPPANLPFSNAETQRIARSTVQVIANACGNHLQEGSGFFLQNNVVVTNAHVVAGGTKVNVLTVDGQSHPATVIAFDPRRDISLLSTGSFTAVPLPVKEASLEDHVAIFGHPGGQTRLRIAPGEIADRVRALGRDIYDESRTTRQVLVMAAKLRQGDSGSGVVDKNGDIVGITFAIAPDDPGVAYALDISELKALTDHPENFDSNTGRCTSD